MAVTRPHTESRQIAAALDAFRVAGGILRTRDALRAGIRPRTRYEPRDDGPLERLFRLADASSLEEPDLVTVALKIPDGVLCLIPALVWHELTTQIPHEIYVAIAPTQIGQPAPQRSRFVQCSD